MSNHPSPQFVVPLTRTEFEQIFQSEQRFNQRLKAYPTPVVNDNVCAVVCYHNLMPEVQVAWYECETHEEYETMMRRAVPFRELQAQQRKKQAAFPRQQ